MSSSDTAWRFQPTDGVTSRSLKALIKAIRATKTIADERALIVKESAVIRTSFKEEGESRARRIRANDESE